MNYNIHPIADRVVCQRIEDKDAREKDGIFIPETAIEKPRIGKVIAVGPGRRDTDGNPVPVNLNVGDLLLLPNFGVVDVKVEDIEIVIVKEDDVLAKLEKKKG